jgi:hypothetical protein
MEQRHVKCKKEFEEIVRSSYFYLFLESRFKYLILDHYTYTHRFYQGLLKNRSIISNVRSLLFIYFFLEKR